MAVICVSWVNGSPSGDGSPGNPYQKIQEATPLPGDEIRVEKSDDPIALTGTLSFLKGSSFVATSDDLTGELFPGDFIKPNNPLNEYGYWEVNNVLPTDIILVHIYPGEDETIDAIKLQPTDTGNEPSLSTITQRLLYNGSDGNQIVLSGGWNSTFDAQTGETWFRQGCLPYTTVKNGYGFYVDNIDYYDISKIHFLRYAYAIYIRYVNDFNFLGSIYLLGNSRYGFYGYISNTVYCEDLICSGNGSPGFYLYMGEGNLIDRLRVFNNSNYGLYLYNVSGIMIKNIHSERNSSRGLRIYRCNGLFLNTILSQNNGSYGIELYMCSGCSISDLNCNNNMTYGLRFYISNFNFVSGVSIVDENVGINVNQAFGNEIFHLDASGNNNDVSITGRLKDVIIPSLSIKHYNDPNDDRYFFYDGDILRIQGAETIDGDGIKFEPNSLSSEEFSYHKWTRPAAAGVDTVLELYLKKDLAFDGECYACAYYMGKIIVDWVELVLTVDYQKFEIEVSGVLLTDTTDLSLLIKVNGTTGAVYADGFPDHTVEDVLAELLAFRGIVEPRLPDNFIMGSGDSENYNDEIISIKERTDNLPDDPAPSQEYDLILSEVSGNVSGLAGEAMRGTDLVPLNPLLEDDIRITSLVTDSEAHTILLNFLVGMESGDWELLEPNDLFFYEAGTTDVLAHWKCFDIEGNPTIEEISKCLRV